MGGVVLLGDYFHPPRVVYSQPLHINLADDTKIFYSQTQHNKLSNDIEIHDIRSPYFSSEEVCLQAHILPEKISQGIKIVQLGQARSGSTFQYRLLCAIVRLRRKDVQCKWHPYMKVTDEEFTNPNISFVHKTHTPVAEFQSLHHESKIHVFSSGNMAQYAHYNQKKDNLRNCSSCEVEKYRCLFNMTNVEVTFLQEVMEMWGILRRCCGFQMSKYERLRLHGCDIKRFQNLPDYPNCEQYNLTKIEEKFLSFPHTHMNNRDGYDNCEVSRTEIVQGKDFNGAPFQSCAQTLKQ